MIDRNGGYAIVDLKGKTLSGTPTTILGTHSAIAKAIAGSKPILLTGLTTGGPCFVQISVDGTSYVISGVYGNDITITSADAVTSAEASGGPKLATWSTHYDGNYTFSFVYEIGMTFSDFVNSTYNIGNKFIIESDFLYYQLTEETRLAFVKPSTDYVYPSDNIQTTAFGGIQVQEYV